MSDGKLFPPEISFVKARKHVFGVTRDKFVAVDPTNVVYDWLALHIVILMVLVKPKLLDHVRKSYLYCHDTER